MDTKVGFVSRLDSFLALVGWALRSSGRYPRTAGVDDNDQDQGSKNTTIVSYLLSIS